VPWQGAPKRVSVGKEALAAPAGGWKPSADGFLTVALSDRFSAFELTIEP
jgi:hypothetical protein